MTVALIIGCTGQDEILQEDAERGIILRKTNVETIGCWGEPGQGGTKPIVRLEVSKPSGTYAIPSEDCPGDVSFDASVDPIRIECVGEIRPLYRLGGVGGVLGEPGDFRPMHEVADVIVGKRGTPILKPLLSAAHARGKMVETLVSLGDTECGEYWDVSFEGLTSAEQQKVLDGLRNRQGSSDIRKTRLANWE